MLDFSVTFNLIFTVVTGALGLFMLVSFIAVAAVGKRRCNAFDVILRILATLAFAASVVLVTSVVFVWLDGEYSVTVAEGAATLMLGPRSFALPLPELFAALRTVMGACLVGALFVFSLVALICDCKLANKKKKRELKVTNSVKTPEQRRIAAEVAKIRAIGNSAVRRTAAAAESADTPAQGENAADENAADENAGADDVHIDVANASADEAEKREPAAQEQTAPDWRATESKHSDFVGLHTNADPDFDTFDSFDDFVGAGDGEGDAAEESVDRDEITADGYAQSDANDMPSDMPTADDIALPTDDALSEYDSDADNDADSMGADLDADESYADESAEDGRDGDSEQEYADDEFDEEPADADEQPNDEQTDGEVDVAADSEQDGEGEYEPNRNIYFPRVRTISRYAEEQPAAAKRSAANGSKPKAQSKTAASGAKKPTAQKKQGASGKPATKPRAQSGSGDGSSRKLPVNRRYVIIDRRSAVNMFGDYLRERDGESKDKLKSSISTIILK